MMKYYLALFLVLFARVQSGCAEDRTKTEIVPCGITSAFGILTAFEKECSIIEITERFQRLYPRADASSMTLQELCGLIHSYDLQTLIARVDFDLLSNAQLPCILCLTKDFGGNKLSIGHAVLLQKKEPADFIISDYQNGGINIKINGDTLKRISDGEVILVSSQPILYPFDGVKYSYLAVATTFLAVLVFLILSCYKRGAAQHLLVKSVLLFLLCLFSGCQRLGEHEPLHFEMNQIDYGVFDCRGRGEMISFEFPFAVNDDRDIVIQKVEASCGCTIPDENILNKKLSPSSKHSLVLTMDVHGRAGFFTTDALVFTDVAPSSPVLLRMSVFVVREMDINPLPVKFQGKYDKPMEPESIFINHLRDVSVPGYVLDAENCDFGIFTLVDLQSSSEKKRGMSNAVLDHICLILATTERFPIGVHEKKIRLAWKEGDRQPITEIPVQIQIMHPFQLAVDHVYLGNLKAMETRDISVKVLSVDMTNVPKPTIESRENVTACLQDDGENLHISLKAPENTGRFEKTVTLKFDGKIPSIPFTISGLVTK